MEKKDRFEEAAALLPPFSGLLKSVPRRIAQNACEIRVRAGRPLVVETLSERYTLRGTSASPDDIGKCIKFFCDYSLYSCEKELSEGWITLHGGHRAGFTGTAVVRDGKVTAIKDISSINLRIASEHKGIAEKLMSLTAFEPDLRGLIIAGAPMSAKTTMLRDYARLTAGFSRTAIIDERGEIAACYRGVPYNDVGVNSDVLDLFPKEQGIMQAIRSMSPEFLICDETGEEYRQLAECAGHGVKLILTVHCGGISELASNRAASYLISAGAVNYVAFLQSGVFAGKVSGLWRVESVEDIGGCCGSNDLYRGRSRILVSDKKTLYTAQNDHSTA